MRPSCGTAGTALVLTLISITSYTSRTSAQVVDVTAAAATGRSSVAECSIAFDPSSGRLVIGGHSDGAPDDLSMHLFRSGDSGAHWGLTRLGQAYDGLGLSRGDPSVAIDERGVVYMAYACVSLGDPFAVVCARSLDGGATFEPAVFVVRENGFAVADKPYLTLGRDAGGRLLVLVAFTRVEPAGKPTGLYLAISRDRGLTFDEPVLVAPSPTSTYGMAATGPSGEIYISWMGPAEPDYQIRLSRSVDGGMTFEPPIVLAATGMGLRHAIPAAPHRGIGAVPSIAVDTSPAHPGRVYVSYVTADLIDRADTDIWCRWADPASSLALFRWTEPIPVHRTDRGSNFHPWLAIEPETGALAVISHNTRGDPARVKVETWLSVSVDGGNRWAERRISESLSDATGLFGISPPDYLEYIGVALSGGMAYCTWAGTGSLNKFHYFYCAVPIAPIVAGRILDVPGGYATPAAALAEAVAGDRIRLDGRLGPFPGPVELGPHITIEGAPGTLATLDAGGAPAAVRITGRFGAALSALRLTGYAAAGVRLEAGRADSIEASGVAVPARVRSSVSLTEVTIEGGFSGLKSNGIPVQIESCRFEGQDTALVLNLHDASEATATRVSRSTFVSSSGAAGSVAIALGGAASEAAPLVERNTIQGFGTGIRLAGTSSSPDGVFRPVVRQNLITHFTKQALELSALPAAPEPVVSCNDFWSPVPGSRVVSSIQASGTVLQENLSVDPFYCGPALGTEDLSLRIDSPVSAGNSPCGPIGALDVRCVPAVLERDSRLARGTRLDLENPIVIPSGRQLIVEGGCRLVAVASGTNRAEEAASVIECAGRLAVHGQPDDPVILEPAAGTVAVSVASSSTARLEAIGMTVVNGESGLELLAGDAAVTGCRFIGQTGTAIRIGGDARQLDMDQIAIENAGMAGIEVAEAAGQARMAGSRIAGCPEAIRLISRPGTATGPTLDLTATLLAQNEVGLRLLPPSGGGVAGCRIDPRLRRNEFRGNVNALVIEPGAVRPDLGLAEPGDNLFWRQTGPAVVVGDAACPPIPALGNRFGPGDRIGAEDPPGSVDWSGWVVQDSPDSTGGALPRMRLLALPNPSTGSVHIQVDMSVEPYQVQVDILDIGGRRLGRIFDGRPAGRRFAFDWNGADAGGRRLASGIYWIVARDDLGNRSVLKVVRVR